MKKIIKYSYFTISYIFIIFSFQNTAKASMNRWDLHKHNLAAMQSDLRLTKGRGQSNCNFNYHRNTENIQYQHPIRASYEPPIHFQNIETLDNINEAGNNSETDSDNSDQYYSNEEAGNNNNTINIPYQSDISSNYEPPTYYQNTDFNNNDGNGGNNEVDSNEGNTSNNLFNWFKKNEDNITYRVRRFIRDRDLLYCY